MVATSMLSSDLQTSSGINRVGEQGLDVEILKESSKNGLINTLNSVRGPVAEPNDVL